MITAVTLHDPAISIALTFIKRIMPQAAINTETLQLCDILADAKRVFEGAHDEDKGHQGCEQLLCEPGDVADVGAGVKHDQEQEHNADPDSYPESEREIVPALVLAHL